MKNIRIMATNNNTIVVKADSKRFGDDAIMYEGRTFMQCCDYVRRALKTNHFKLSGFSCCAMYTDAEGRTMPRILNVDV